MNKLLNFKEYKERTNDLKNVSNWIKRMPNKNNVKNIFSFSNECYELELNIINNFKNCKHFQILKPNIKEYSECIDNIFGNFKFKISNDSFEDFLPEPNITYDLIILYHTLNSFNYDLILEKCSKMINNKSRILIFNFNLDSLLSIKNYFNDSFIFFDLNEIKSSLYKKKFKIFNTSLNSSFNLKGISKLLMENITDLNLDEEKFNDILIHINNKYKQNMTQKINIFILNF